MSIVYVFSMPAVLRQAYHAFRVTHMLNILLYFLTIAHGLPKLLDVSSFRKFTIKELFLKFSHPNFSIMSLVRVLFS